MKYLSQRELELMRLSSEVTIMFNELKDFEEATTIIATKHPSYSNELWNAYHATIKANSSKVRLGVVCDKKVTCAVCNAEPAVIKNKNGSSYVCKKCYNATIKANSTLSRTSLTLVSDKIEMCNYCYVAPAVNENEEGAHLCENCYNDER